MIQLFEYLNKGDDSVLDTDIITFIAKSNDVMQNPESFEFVLYITANLAVFWLSVNIAVPWLVRFLVPQKKK